MTEYIKATAPPPLIKSGLDAEVILFRSTLHFSKAMHFLLRESIMLPTALFVKNIDFLFDDKESNQ